MNRTTTHHPIRRTLVTMGLAIGTLASSSVFACGSEPYLGMVCMTAASYCPRGYVEANGGLLPISGNEALYSLIGIYFGGDGSSNFGVPDLRGRTPTGYGNGPGLTPLPFAQKSGVETVTLGTTELPTHTHTATTTVTLHAQDVAANSPEPANNVLADPAEGLPGDRDIYSTGTPDVVMNNAAASAVTEVAPTGNGQPFGIRSPYLAMRYCIATVGIYPPRP